jgi:hypothetical protein
LAGSPFLAELPEACATGTTREIYSEIKRLGAVPMVALVYRHLATLPGALEWAWSAIRPLMTSGRLQEDAWRLACDVRSDPVVAIPPEALRALGMDEAAVREIHDVVDAYNRANPVNLLVLTCLALVADGAAPAAAPSGSDRAWVPPPPIRPLRPMIDPASIPAAVLDLLARLSPGGGPSGTRLVPSLYRHFGDRPHVLALLGTLLLPRFEDGSIDRGIESIRCVVADAAADLRPGLIARTAPHPDISGVLERFGRTIPEMIVVGGLLKEALPASSGQPQAAARKAASSRGMSGPAG